MRETRVFKVERKRILIITNLKGFVDSERRCLAGNVDHTQTGLWGWGRRENEARVVFCVSDLSV